MQEKSKTYYEANKEKINKKNICECGSEYTSTNKKQHINSIKHQTFLNNQI